MKKIRNAFLNALLFLLCLQSMHVNVRMISQGASKTNIALVMDCEKAQEAVRALHLEFYGETTGCGKYSNISK